MIANFYPQRKNVLKVKRFYKQSLNMLVVSLGLYIIGI